MRQTMLVLLGLSFAGPLAAQGASADSAAIVAAPDYLRTTARGEVEGREAALESWRSRPALRNLQPADLRVRVYFVRRDGRWLLAALHGSEVAEP